MALCWAGAFPLETLHLGSTRSSVSGLFMDSLSGSHTAERSARILLVEDDDLIADGIGRALRGARFEVVHLPDGKSADAALQSGKFDLVVLDLSLPDMDGVDVLRRLRARGVSIPVLVVTARDTLQNRIDGLDMGADDYVTKPFELRELEARCRALLRRSSELCAQLGAGDLKFDPSTRQFLIDGMLLDLSAREVEVLQLLLESQNKVVAKEALVARLSRSGELLGSNAIEVYIHRLRKKLGVAGITLRTVRGLGYMIERR